MSFIVPKMDGAFLRTRGLSHVFRYDDRSRNWTLAPAFDLTPSVFNTLVGLAWLGSLAIPTGFESLQKLAEIGGLSRKLAREIYDQVEAATIGGWRKAAIQADVPEPMISYWEKEIDQQTRLLRENARVRAQPKVRRKS